MKILRNLFSTEDMSHCLVMNEINNAHSDRNTKVDIPVVQFGMDVYKLERFPFKVSQGFLRNKPGNVDFSVKVCQQNVFESLPVSILGFVFRCR